MLAHFDELSANPRHEPGSDLLLDLSDRENLPPADKLRTAAERVTSHASPVCFDRLAAVVPSNALFGMLRMFHMSSANAFADAQIFGERDQALQRLGGSGAAARVAARSSAT